MATFLLYAKGQKEFEVEQSLLDLGLLPWVGRKMEVRRVAKKRDPIITVKPYLGNYVFCEMELESLMLIGNVKYLAGTHHMLRRDDVRSLVSFKAAVKAELDAVQAHVDNQAYRLCEYSKGDPLRVVSGGFADMLGSFRKVVEVAGRIKYRMDVGMMGRNVPMDIDPAELKRVV